MAKACVIIGLGLVICGLQIWITFASKGESSHSNTNNKKVDPNTPQALPFCGSTSRNRNDAKSKTTTKLHANRSLLLVSTLDGQVSALDAKTGRLLWAVVTDPGIMMSSSISKIEMSSKGEWFRLIPSMDGGLFRFDGRSLEALPITSDTLLSSSLKLADDVVIAGAKDNRIFGVDFTTGKLRYSCSMSGCEYYGSDIVNQDDILVVRRHTNVVRAIDPKTGLEKWNYSVGRHELSFVEGSPDMVCSTDKANNEADVEVDSDGISGQQEQLDVKIVTSQGVVLAKSHEDPENTVWQHKFETPVLDTWLLQGGNLEVLNLFDKMHTTSIPVEIENAHDNSAMLYVGIHNKQLYIQQSHAMMEKVSRAAHEYTQMGSERPYPRIQWKPYLVTAQSRTPYVSGINKDDSLNLVNPDKMDMESTALMIRHETDYPYDGGYYLFPDETLLDVEIFPNTTILDEEETLDQIIVSLWYWWREIAGIAFATIILNLLITRYCMKNMRKTVENNNNQIIILEKASCLTEESMSTERRASYDKDLQPAPTDYVSRYMTDFEPVYCLGKGGFGVVFHARNKIDDCDYAIKRICLPNRDDAREKVMREVKALAKLDHVGIVRYYNAWLECPPTGWQEQIDKEWELKGLITPNVCLSSEDSAETAIKTLSKVNPFNPFGNNFLDEEKALLRCNNNTTSSFGFIPNKQDEESGSFSFEKKSSSHHLNDQCQRLGCPLESGDSGQVWDRESVPFHRYHSKTIDVSGDSFIVFEDSGCGEKSSSIGKLGDSQDNGWSGDGGTSSRDSSQKTTSREAVKNLCNQRTHSPAGTNIRPKSFGTSITSSYSVPGFGSTPKIYLHIQMQLCKKENLKDWLNANSTARDKIQVLDFFDQIVSAVEYVHDQGLMHRDLKPSNIFFSMDGSIKVGDFGLVTTMAEGSDDRTPSGPGPYRQHTDQVGTQLYMSPEQITGQSYSHKVDIFSLGLIFFELLVPFTTQMERLRVMLDVKKQKFPPCFKEETPEECSFVQQLLARSPESRPSASDIKQHSLLQAFQPRPEILQHRRTRNMSRTYSTSSSGSGSFD